MSAEEVASYFPSGVFTAPWGEPMAVQPGDYLAATLPQLAEIYRIERSAFASTYQPDEAESS